MPGLCSSDFFWFALLLFQLISLLQFTGLCGWIQWVFVAEFSVVTSRHTSPSYQQWSVWARRYFITRFFLILFPVSPLIYLLAFLWPTASSLKMLCKSIFLSIRLKLLLKCLLVTPDLSVVAVTYIYTHPRFTFVPHRPLRFLLPFINGACILSHSLL